MLTIVNGAVQMDTRNQRKDQSWNHCLATQRKSKQHTWPLGRVMELIVGRDGLVRFVKILADGSVVT